MQPRIGKADLHMHSTVSDGMMTIREILDWVQEKTDLDVIGVTDHDDIEGGLLAREMALQGGYRFEVIPGAEITTRDGHLLALFIEKPVRSLRGLQDTLDEVTAQGGLCVVPHPMSWLTRSIGERSLDRAMAHFQPGIVGIETENPTIAGKVVYEKVRRINRGRYRLGETGGSDAHFLPDIGSAFTAFHGSSAADLRLAIEHRKSAGVRAAGPFEKVPASALIAQQGRSLVMLPVKRVRHQVAKRLSKLRGQTP